MSEYHNLSAVRHLIRGATRYEHFVKLNVACSLIDLVLMWLDWVELAFTSSTKSLPPIIDDGSLISFACAMRSVELAGGVAIKEEHSQQIGSISGGIVQSGITTKKARATLFAAFKAPDVKGFRTAVLSVQVPGCSLARRIEFMSATVRDSVSSDAQNLRDKIRKGTTPAQKAARSAKEALHHVKTRDKDSKLISGAELCMAGCGKLAASKGKCPCGFKRYCSKACQVACWNAHKAFHNRIMKEKREKKEKKEGEDVN